MKKFVSLFFERLLKTCFFLTLIVFFFSEPSQAQVKIIEKSDVVIARAELATSSSVEIDTPRLSIKAVRSAIKSGWTIKISKKSKSGSFEKTFKFKNVADYPEDISIIELDPKNSAPEIIFSAFTGGAHCCSLPVFLSETSHGNWNFTTYPMLDGGPPSFEDIDQDGYAEIISVDQSFLYAFDCYACSYAPYRIEQLRKGKILDISKTAVGLERLRTQLETMEADAERNTELWRSNGFLAAWVALKSILGQGQDAWKKMLLLYDRNSSFGLYECQDKSVKAFDCPSEKLVMIPFPIALEDHLKKGGYWDRSIEKP